MNYEQYTNNNITTYNNKRICRSLIKFISKLSLRYTHKHKDNRLYLLCNMSKGYRRDLNKM